MARKNYTAAQIIGMLREAEVRLPQKGDACFLTVKSDGGLVRAEYEITINAEQIETRRNGSARTSPTTGTTRTRLLLYPDHDLSRPLSRPADRQLPSRRSITPQLRGRQIGIAGRRMPPPCLTDG